MMVSTEAHSFAGSISAVRLPIQEDWTFFETARNRIPCLRSSHAVAAKLGAVQDNTGSRRPAGIPWRFSRLLQVKGGSPEGPWERSMDGMVRLQLG